jgi:cAMP-dependent protein kinase regulator
VATKKGDGNKAPEIVFSYKSGDYFGELALLKNAPRAASIIAQTDVSVVYLDRNSFKRLIGPIDDILRRNFKRYEKFMS